MRGLFFRRLNVRNSQLDKLPEQGPQKMVAGLNGFSGFGLGVYIVVSKSRMFPSTCVDMA